MTYSDAWLKAGFPNVALLPLAPVYNTLVEAMKERYSVVTRYNHDVSPPSSYYTADFLASYDVDALTEFDNDLDTLAEEFLDTRTLSGGIDIDYLNCTWNAEKLAEYYEATHDDAWILDYREGSRQEVFFLQPLFPARWAYQRMWALNRLTHMRLWTQLMEKTRLEYEGRGDNPEDSFNNARNAAPEESFNQFYQIYRRMYLRDNSCEIELENNLTADRRDGTLDGIETRDIVLLLDSSDSSSFVYDDLGTGLDNSPQILLPDENGKFPWFDRPVDFQGPWTPGNYGFIRQTRQFADIRKFLQYKEIEDSMEK